MDYPVSKGQKLEAEVIRWADAGKGVAQIGGLNVFVDQAMPASVWRWRSSTPSRAMHWPGRCACSRLRRPHRAACRFTTAAAAAACST